MCLVLTPAWQHSSIVDFTSNLSIHSYRPHHILSSMHSNILRREAIFSKVFAITPAGRQRFYQLMMDTTSNQGTYQRLFHIKALHLEYVSPEDQLSLVDHYLSYCQMGLHYQQAESRDFATNTIKQQSVSRFYNSVALDLMDLVRQQWQQELNWTQRLRERIVDGSASNKIDTSK